MGCRVPDNFRHGGNDALRQMTRGGLMGDKVGLFYDDASRTSRPEIPPTVGGKVGPAHPKSRPRQWADIQVLSTRRTFRDF